MILSQMVNTGVLEGLPYSVLTGTEYLTVMGSHAYGAENANSDYDLYGFYIPEKQQLFPDDYIHGFSTPKNILPQYEKKDVLYNGKEWDIVIYNIVKYFKLCADGNPNMIDSLFTDNSLVFHDSEISRLVRKNRREFLSKQCYLKFRGFAGGEYKELLKSVRVINGVATYDLKAAYNLVRLSNECMQILSTGDLDLKQSKNTLRDIRYGKWQINSLIDYCKINEEKLQELYDNCQLPERPNEKLLTDLLFKCLNIHYKK